MCACIRSHIYIQTYSCVAKLLEYKCIHVFTMYFLLSPSWMTYFRSAGEVRQPPEFRKTGLPPKQTNELNDKNAFRVGIAELGPMAQLSASIWVYI